MLKDMLDVGFKGNRSYIQGPDIHEQAMHCIQRKFPGGIRDIEFLIQNMTACHLQLQIEPVEGIHAPLSDDVAILRFTVGEERKQARIMVASGAPEKRGAFDESKVTFHCRIDKEARSVQLINDCSGFSSIEKLVSMNKALHQAVLDIPGGTQWVYCRWSSPAWPLPVALGGAKVTLKQTLGTRLTRADVTLDGLGLGQIYFSAKPVP